MKVLLTGATGFLGSHLAKMLLVAGYEVHILLRRTSSLKRLNEYINELNFHYTEDGISKAFENNSPYKVVVHTATCYGRNDESEFTVFDTNLRLSLELLENAVLYKTESFINADTVLDKYLNSYTLTKKQFLEWGKYFSDKSKIKFCNIKLEHMYGPDDDDSKFTTYIVKSCLNNVPEIKLTPGDQFRDFIYISDVVSAYKLLIEKEDLPCYEDLELGSGQAVTIKNFVITVHKKTKSKSKLDFTAMAYRKNEVMHSQADNSKLFQYGWKPLVSLNDGLRKTIDGENR